MRRPSDSISGPTLRFGQISTSTSRKSTVPAQRGAAQRAQVTIDLDTTDVEVYGRQKRRLVFG
jgi:hypothetical protein